MLTNGLGQALAVLGHADEWGGTGLGSFGPWMNGVEHVFVIVGYADEWAGKGLGNPGPC